MRLCSTLAYNCRPIQLKTVNAGPERATDSHRARIKLTLNVAIIKCQHMRYFLLFVFLCKRKKTIYTFLFVLVITD